MRVLRILGWWDGSMEKVLPLVTEPLGGLEDGNRAQTIIERPPQRENHDK